MVDVEMALAGAIDAIGPVQAGVEPLRRIGRGHLAGQHEAQLVEERLRVFLRVEIAAFITPIGPGAGETVEHLLGRGFADKAFGRGQLGEGRFVGDAAPQEGGDRVFLDALQAAGTPALAEIFLGQHVAGDLTPGGGNLYSVLRENGRAIGIADFALGLAEFNIPIRRLSRCRIMPFDPHSHPPDLAQHGSRATVMTRAAASPWRTENRQARPTRQPNARDRNSRMIAVVQKRALIDRFSYSDQIPGALPRNREARCKTQPNRHDHNLGPEAAGRQDIVCVSSIDATIWGYWG